MADTHLNINQAQDRSTYFQSCVERMLTYWRDHEAMKNIDVAVLDRERNRILNNITLGLDLQPLWPLVKKLVIAFAPYMERRGFWDTWHSILEEAIHMAQRAEDVDAETTLTAFLARLCQRMSRPQEVVHHYRRVIQLARQCGNQFEEARACSNLGYFYIDGGHWWRSEVFSKYALAIFEALESDHGRAHTHNHLGLLYLRQRRWNEAKTNLVAACDIWQVMEDNHNLLSGYMNLGLLYIELKNSQLALTNLMMAYEVATLTGEMSGIARILHNIAIAHRQNMEWTEAEKYAKKAEKGFREFEDAQGLADVWQTLGVIYMHIQQETLAIQYFSDSISMHKKLNSRQGEARVRSTTKKLAVLSGDDKTASLLQNLAISI